MPPTRLALAKKAAAAKEAAAAAAAGRTRTTAPVRAKAAAAGQFAEDVNLDTVFYQQDMEQLEIDHVLHASLLSHEKGENRRAKEEAGKVTSPVLPIENGIESRDTQIAELLKLLEVRTSQLEVRNSQLEVRNSQLEVKTSQLEVRTSQLEVRNSQFEVRNSQLEVINSEIARLNTEMIEVVNQFQEEICLLKECLPQESSYFTDSDTALVAESEALIAEEESRFLKIRKIHMHRLVTRRFTKWHECAVIRKMLRGYVQFSKAKCLEKHFALWKTNAKAIKEERMARDFTEIATKLTLGKLKQKITPVIKEFMKEKETETETDPKKVEQLIQTLFSNADDTHDPKAKLISDYIEMGKVNSRLFVLFVDE
jgi:hypothetical protein